MRDIATDIAEQAAQNPKVATAVAAGTTTLGIEGFMFNVLPEFLSLIASGIGIVVALFVLRVQILTARKISLESRKIIEELERDQAERDLTEKE